MKKLHIPVARIVSFDTTTWFQRTLNLPVVAIAVIAVIVSGCASTGSISEKTGGLSGNSLGNDVVVLETVSEVENSEDQRQLLHAMVAAGLQSRGSFSKVVTSGGIDVPAEHVQITLQVKDLNKVSKTARFWGGALAGRANMLVEVEATDQPEGAQLTRFEATGKSSAGWGGAGTTDQAIERLAEQIVAALISTP